MVVEPEDVSEIKTRVMADAMASLGIGRSLFVIAEGDDKIELSRTQSAEREGVCGWSG